MDSVVRVQRQVCDRLALRDDELCQVVGTLDHGLVDAGVTVLEPPRVVDVERKQADVAAGRPGGVGAMREVGGEERFNVVADEDTGNIPVQRARPVLTPSSKSGAFGEMPRKTNLGLVHNSIKDRYC